MRIAGGGRGVLIVPYSQLGLGQALVRAFVDGTHVPQFEILVEPVIHVLAVDGVVIVLVFDVRRRGDSIAGAKRLVSRQMD